VKLTETKFCFVRDPPTPSVFGFSFTSPFTHEKKSTVSAQVGGVSATRDVDAGFPLVQSTAMSNHPETVSVVLFHDVWRLKLKQNILFCFSFCSLLYRTGFTSQRPCGRAQGRRSVSNIGGPNPFPPHPCLLPFLPSPSHCVPFPSLPSPSSPPPFTWGSGGVAPGQFFSGTHARTRVLVHF
jgi:hypothetical protein